MDKIEIRIVGRDPDGVIDAVEVRCTYKGKRINGAEEEWAQLRNRLSLVLREWSKEIIHNGPKWRSR